jgi:hypothetical protein
MIGEASAPRTSKGAAPIACALIAGILTVALSLAEGGASALAVGTLSALTWGCLLIGVVFGLLPLRSVPYTGALAAAALIALAVLTGLSMAWANDDGRAFIELARVLGYLGAFVLILAASPRGSAPAWLGGFSVGLAVVAALALGSRLLAPGSGAEELAALPESTIGRLDFPIGYWNALGAMMAAAVVLFSWAGAWGRSLWLRGLAIALIPPAALVIFFTESRGAIVAAALGLVVLIAFSRAPERTFVSLLPGIAGAAALIAFTLPRDELVDGLPSGAADSQGVEVLVATIIAMLAVGGVRVLGDSLIQRARLPRGVRIAVAGSAAVALVVALLAVDVGERWEQFKEPPPATPEEGPSRLTSAAGSGRYQFWTAAGDAFSSEPIRGIGAGAYEFWWNQNGTTTAIVKNAHSLPLETLAELGVLGAACLGGFFLVVILAAAVPRERRTGEGEIAAALAVFLAIAFSAAIDWTWEVPAATVLLIGCAALLTGPATRAAAGDESLDRSEDAPALLWRRGTLGVLITLALAGSVAGWVVVLTESRIDSSERLVREGDLAGAATDARAAASIQPWSPEPWLQLALVQELGGDLVSARASIREAISRSPEDWRLPFVQSRLETTAGNVKGGQRALAASQRLYPRATIFDRLELSEPTAEGAG